MNLRFRIRTSLDSDPNLVKSIIIDVIGDCEFTTENPKTEVLLYDITETALVFRLDCWVEDYNKERKAKDWILIEILDRFKSKGIGIPFPHLTLFPAIYRLGRWLWIIRFSISFCLRGRLPTNTSRCSSYTNGN